MKSSLLILALLASGCAGTGVTAQNVADFAGAITDRELARNARVTADEIVNHNMELLGDKLAKVDGELQLIKGSADGMIATKDAVVIVKDVVEGMALARGKLAEIRKAQASADVHYHSQVRIMSHTLGLLRALADRDKAAAEANSAGISGIKKVGGILRRGAVAAATGGITR